LSTGWKLIAVPAYQSSHIERLLKSSIQE